MVQRDRSRGVTAAAVLLVLVAGTVACGKAPSEVTVGPPTAGLLSEAAVRTRAAGTGRVAGTVALKGQLAIFGDQMSYDLAFTTSGEYDLGARKDHLLATLDRVDQQQTSPTSARGTTTTDPSRPGDTFEQFSDGDHFVERQVIGGRPKLVDGKEWVRKERRRSTTTDPFDAVFRLSGLDDDGQTINPDTLLTQIEKVSDNVSELPAETVRDVETRHLRASVSVQRLYDDTARATGTTVVDREQTCTREALGDLSITIDVNLGTDGYVRRVAVNGDLGAVFDAMFGCMPGVTTGTGIDQSKASVFTFTTSIDYFDIGQPVTFTPPDAAAVTEREKFTPVGTAIS